jgi:hypothetical protein
MRGGKKALLVEVRSNTLDGFGVIVPMPTWTAQNAIAVKKIRL